METLGEYLESHEGQESREWKVRELYKMGILEALYNGTVPYSLRSEGWWTCDQILYERVVGRLRLLEAARPVFKELGDAGSRTVFRQVLRTLLLMGVLETDTIEAPSKRMAFIFYKLTASGKDSFESNYRALITEQRTLLDFGESEEIQPEPRDRRV